MKRSLAIIVALTAIIGCRKLDSAKFEKDVQAKLVAAGVANATVTCPKDVAGKKGVKFTCDVKIEDTSYDYDVTITDVHGGQFDLMTGFRKGNAFPRQKLIDLLVPSIKSQINADPTVDCGKEPLLFPENNTLHCQMTAKGETAKIRIDVDGTNLKEWHVE